MAEEEQRRLDEEERRLRDEQIKYDAMVAARDQKREIEERDAADREERLKAMLREKNEAKMAEKRKRYNASEAGLRSLYKTFLKNRGYYARSLGK